MSEKAEEGSHLWHQQLGHMSEKGLQVLMNYKLLSDLKSLKLDFCKYCMFRRQLKKRFQTRNHNSKQILDYIHCDLWGPYPTVSYGGASYFLTFIDDFS